MDRPHMLDLATREAMRQLGVHPLSMYVHCAQKADWTPSGAIEPNEYFEAVARRTKEVFAAPSVTLTAYFEYVAQTPPAELPHIRSRPKGSVETNWNPVEWRSEAGRRMALGRLKTAAEAEYLGDKLDFAQRYCVSTDTLHLVAWEIEAEAKRAA